MGIGLQRFAVESDWRKETLRTNLWLIPAIESVAAVLLFVLTLNIDQAASHGEISLPSWVISGCWQCMPRPRARLSHRMNCL